MSTDQARGFLEHIRADPDEDAPRLIFADWLEEHGDAARAEFIRVQIERARLPEWDGRQVGLGLRERALLESHEAKWKRELPRIRGITWQGFRRGFVATATLSSFEVFRAKASDCWAAAPIEAVELRWARGCDSLDNITPLGGLRELSLIGFPLDYEVYLLADSLLLSTLRTLNITACHLETHGFRVLVASPHLGNLRALRVPRNSIGNGGVSALLDAASLTSLEELDLSEESNYGRYGEDPIIDAVGVEALTSWPGMKRLRSLNLSGNSIGRRGLRTLLASPRATGLKTLMLVGNDLSRAAMQEFAAARPKLQLDVLNLRDNVIGDHGATELARASCLREVKVLELDRCEIHSSGARRLAKAPFLGSLRHLNVNHNSFGPEGLLALLQQKPPHLHTLQMVNNDLGHEGLLHLTESPDSDVLLKVNLAQNGLGNRAVRALAKTKHLRNLRVLRLNDNRFSEAASVDLEDSPLGKRLAILEMEDEEVGYESPF